MNPPITVTLNSDNDWKATIKLPQLNESGGLNYYSWGEYSVEESPVPGGYDQPVYTPGTENIDLLLPDVIIEGGTPQHYEKVSDVSDLQTGAKYLIVAKNGSDAYAIGNTVQVGGDPNGRPKLESITITQTDGNYSITGGDIAGYLFTCGSGNLTDYYSFKNSGGFLAMDTGGYPCFEQGMIGGYGNGSNRTEWALTASAPGAFHFQNGDPH